MMGVLEEENPAQKLKNVLTLVKKELEVSQLQQKITTQIQEKVSTQQREFMLREQPYLIHSCQRIVSRANRGQLTPIRAIPILENQTD